MISLTHDRLFGPGGCLTSLAIRNYIGGTLPVTGRLQVEEHILSCKLCAEAVKGFKKHGRNRYVQNDVEFLSKRIRRTYGRTGYQPVRWSQALIVLSLSAFLVLLLGIFYILRQGMTDQKIQQGNRQDSIVNTVNSVNDTVKGPAVKTAVDEPFK